MKHVSVRGHKTEHDERNTMKETRRKKHDGTNTMEETRRNKHDETNTTKETAQTRLTAIIVVSAFQKEVGKPNPRSTGSSGSTGGRFKHRATFQDGGQRHVFG